MNIQHKHRAQCGRGTGKRQAGGVFLSLSLSAEPPRRRAAATTTTDTDRQRTNKTNPPWSHFSVRRMPKEIYKKNSLVNGEKGRKNAQGENKWQWESKTLRLAGDELRKRDGGGDGWREKHPQFP